MRSLLPALPAMLAITGSTGASTAEPDFGYVALGDSAAAGPLLPQQDPEDPGCLRSSRHWPSAPAERIDAYAAEFAAALDLVSARAPEARTTCRAASTG